MAALATKGSQYAIGGDLVYRNWALGEPNNSGGEDCAETRCHFGTTWNDGICWRTFIHMWNDLVENYILNENQLEVVGHQFLYEITIFDWFLPQNKIIQIKFKGDKKKLHIWKSLCMYWHHNDRNNSQVHIC